MRVLYLHQYFTAPSAAGGTRSYEFARRLIARGHEVTMLTSSAFIGPEWTALGRPAECEIASIPVSVVDVPYSNRLGYGGRIISFVRFAAGAALRAVRQSADVVYATSTPLTIGIPAMIAARRLRIPLVFEVRDLWPEIPIAVGALRNPATIAAARLLERTIYRVSTAIVALSPGMKDGIVRQGASEGKVTVIPNASDLDLFTPDRRRGIPLRTSLGLGADDLLVVYAGTFGRVNWVGYIVELARRLRDRRPRVGFLLLGDGVERDLIAGQAESAGVLDSNVWLREPVAKCHMPGFLAAADACMSTVIPVREMWNNSANKFFDALAAGRPIIINHGGWQAELIEEKGCGLVLPWQDLDDAAARLHDFLQDRSRLAAAGAAARATAEADFDRDALTDRLEAVLLRAIR